MENRKKISLKYTALSKDDGSRVDVVASQNFSNFSRAHIQKWIKDGNLLVNGKEIKAKYSLQSQDIISVDFWEDSQLSDLPEDIELDILFEDEQIIVINKPPALVVHPGSGNASGTLVNALLSHDQNLSFLPRAGIVHRLDKDTSGLMVISKTETSYLDLVKQMKQRSVKRTYLAIVVGNVIAGRTIDEPIGRHPKIRTKQAVIGTGKQAITRFRVTESYEGYSLLSVNLETGRTHQIRVHLSHLGFPIIGDPVYGSRNKFSSGTSDQLKKIISNFRRQALHATELELVHPTSKERVNFKVDMPLDMRCLIEKLKDGN